MDSSHFQRLCARLHHLSPRQVSELERRLAGLGERMDALATLDGRAADMRSCPRCGAEQLGRWGVDRRGLQRLRCRACGRTCSASAGSPLAGLRRPEAFRAVLEDMISAVRPASCRRLAAQLGVDKTTVWRWRMRILAALQRATGQLGGVVEADQTTRRESRKGSREWRRHAQNPEAFPKPPRPTWRDWRRQGLPLPLAPTRWRIPVPGMVERAGARRAERLQDHNLTSLHAALDPAVRPDAVLCSDGDAAFATFARARGIAQYVINASRGPRVVEGAFHIQAVNQLHAALKDFFRPFRGPATQYLDGYLAWFVARQNNRDPWNAMIAA